MTLHWLICAGTGTSITIEFFYLATDTPEILIVH